MNQSVLIIEDEVLAAETLWKMVEDLDPAFTLANTISSIKEAKSYLRENTPNLIFMDISLSDGSAFKIFEEVEVKSPVIFTTAYDQYALDAFEVNGLHYLVKPIRKEKLQEALDRFKELGTGNSAMLRQIAEKLNISSNQKRFSVQIRNKIVSIPVEDVAYFMGEDKIVYLFTRDGKKYIYDSTLRDLEPLLDANEFFRINPGRHRIQ